MDKITDTLYVGAMSDLNPLGDTLVEPDEFENVVTLGEGETPHTTDQFDVENRKGTEEAFFDAVDEVRKDIQAEELTFVHCTAGVSRGTSVTATALAAERDETLEDAFESVEDLHENTAPHPDLQYMAQEYLANRTGNYAHKERYEGDKVETLGATEEPDEETTEEEAEPVDDMKEEDGPDEETEPSTDDADDVDDDTVTTETTDDSENMPADESQGIVGKILSLFGL